MTDLAVSSSSSSRTLSSSDDPSAPPETSQKTATRSASTESAKFDRSARSSTSTSSSAPPDLPSGRQTTTGDSNAAKLERGAKGDDVSALQSKLSSQGFDPGPVDGKFGPLTEKAVRAFQKANGLETDGVVGRRTRAALTPQQTSSSATTSSASTSAETSQTSDTSSTSSTSSATSALGKSLNNGFQYLIGDDFKDAKSALLSSGSKGAAIVDPKGATAADVAQLKANGVDPIAYVNAFQTQPGEKLPPGVGVIGHDGQWGEQIPDFKNPKWQEKKIAEAVDAAKKGFSGVMLDNVPNAGTSKEAADFVKKMAEAARAASGNPNFGVILQNGEKLVQANPSLIEQGYVNGLQKEDVSYSVTGAGTGTGHKTSSEDRADTDRTYRELRAKYPNLPMIAVDYPSTDSQAAEARARATADGFNVSHIALRDGDLQRISKATRVVHPVAE